jgi:hypothetical protein
MKSSGELEAVETKRSNYFHRWFLPASAMYLVEARTQRDGSISDHALDNGKCG